MTPLPPALFLPTLALPKLCLFEAPILDLVFPMPVPLAKDEPDVARCDANLAMTFDREMRGFRPGSTFGLTGMGGF